MQIGQVCMEQINHKLVMAEADKMTATAGVKVKGNKKYLMVKDRVEVFRKFYGLNLGIDTTVLHIDDSVVRVQAKIIDANNKVIGSGLAEEVRASSNITRTSAVEVCESSAIGRALSSIGLHGGEYASAEEMISAVQQQENIKSPQELVTEELEVDHPIPKETKRDEHPLDDISFHPRENWEAWRDINMQTLGKYKFVAEFQKWIAANNEYLVEYAKTDNDSYQVLKQFINTKMKGCAE
ncbi:rad52-like recombinase [uncultured Mediterranean phage uvMED]|nr:rad52-like recombinase [uncultured Mediterranean phage uvMED]BAQ85829.1 rad52-like recombinase [uncultured Mediterranean phage uvMED]BAQ85873.1 rad52-like recombinase [uncultured Mediterranean phage uvMED]